MAERTLTLVHGASAARRPQIVPSSVLGTLIFVATELMFFAGLISAFTIVRSSALQWPPAGQPRLPVEETAFNTAALLLSGVVLFAANRAHRGAPSRASVLLLLAILLGAFFVGFQGVEWLALVRQGLTLTSSTHGSFFSLIVGLHAAHAVVALVVLGWAWLRLVRGRLERSRFVAAQIFWYFVVGIWPILYLRIYL